MPAVGEGSSSEYRDNELRRRLEVLKEQFEKGKVSIAAPIADEMERSLLAVRYGPDGQIDLSTVDSRVRAFALAVTATHDREDMKDSIPLREIQETYFSWLETNFGEYYQIMVDRELTPHQVGIVASRNADVVEYTASVIPKFMEMLTEFWESMIEPSYAHLEDMNCLKAVFGGDFFPSSGQNIAAKCGLYTDMIILPDPFLRSAPMFTRWSPEEQTRYFLKHALNVLQYKKLALAELDPPLIVVVPERPQLDEDEGEFMFSLAEPDGLMHAGILFGRTFESFDDLIQFADPLDTTDRVLDALKDPSRLLFDTEWKGDTEAQLQRAVNDDHGNPFELRHAGRLVAMQAFGRMSQANDLLLKSQRLRGTPLIDAPTSWQYFVWKLEYDASRLENMRSTDLHMIQGLQSASVGEMQWLGKIPPEASLEMRRQGAVDEIRQMLSQGIAKITESNPENFAGTSEQVVRNIQAGFEEHQKQIQFLRQKQWRFAGRDVGSWLVVGTLEVAAAATGTPVFGLTAFAAHQLTDIPKLKDLPDSMRKLREESQRVKRSPVGLLFQYKN